MSRKYGCTIDFNARIAIDCLEDLKIGQRVYIGAYTIIRVKNQSGMRKSALAIGEDTYIGELNNIRAGGGTIKIGKKCLISQQVSIIASNHGIGKEMCIMDQPWGLEKNFIEINDDVWVGCGSVILPGVRIGAGAVISAGSMISKDVPGCAIVAGNPMKILRFRE